VLIAILAFIVLGVFVAAEVPRTGSSASNSAKVLLNQSASPASAQPTTSVKGIPTEIRGKGGSAYLDKDPGSGHHPG
jgi:hypothetical protein